MNDQRKPTNQSTNQPSKIFSTLRTIAWRIAVLVLVLVMVWWIRRLLPGFAPAASGPEKPGPTATLAPYPEDIFYYTVRPGDTLANIAEKAGLSVSVLIERNNLPESCATDPYLEAADCALDPGMQLILGFRDTLPPTPPPTEPPPG